MARPGPLIQNEKAGQFSREGGPESTQRQTGLIPEEAELSRLEFLQNQSRDAGHPV